MFAASSLQVGHHVAQKCMSIGLSFLTLYRELSINRKVCISKGALLNDCAL